MKNSALTFWIVLLVVGVGAYGAYLAWPKQSPPPVVKPRTPVGKPDELIERSGRVFSFEEMDGKVWLGSFFFANCPGSCWQLNQALAGVANEFKADDLRLVSITCDPDNDTPEALTKYAQRLAADTTQWAFLTGKMDYISQIGKDKFKQDVRPAMHTNRAMVFDRNGKVQGSYDMIDPKEVEKLKTLVKKLLAAKPGEEVTLEVEKQG